MDVKYIKKKDEKHESIKDPEVKSLRDPWTETEMKTLEEKMRKNR